MYPPADPKLFVNVPIMTSISFGDTPKCYKHDHHQCNPAMIPNSMFNLSDTAPGLAERPNAVSFVQVQICIVLLLQTHNLRQIDQGPFHAVHALNTDDDLLPHGMCPGLPVNDGLSDDSLEISSV